MGVCWTDNKKSLLEINYFQSSQIKFKKNLFCWLSIKKQTRCSLCPQAATEFELHGLQPNAVHQVQVQAIAYWGQKRLKSPKAQLSFTTMFTGKPQSHWWTCGSCALFLSSGSSVSGSLARSVSSDKLHDRLESEPLVWGWNRYTWALRTCLAPPPRRSTKRGLSNNTFPVHTPFFTPSASHFFGRLNWGEFSSMLVCSQGPNVICYISTFQYWLCTTFPFWLTFDIWPSAVLSPVSAKTWILSS